MATDTCEHDNGIAYKCRHYPSGSSLHAVHRFTCDKCKAEARIVDTVNPHADSD